MNNEIKKITVYGSGCESCKKLFKLTKEATNNLKIDIDVKYIDDIQEIIKLGIMSFPVLFINEDPLVIGKIPSIQKIEEIIKNYQKGIITKISGCACGNDC